MKQKFISVILIISIILNIGFLMFINRLSSDITQGELTNISSADIAIDNALNYSGQLVSQWSELTDAEIIHYLNQVDKEIVSAMLLLNEADSYFAPLKEYSHHGKMFAEKILIENKNEDIYNAYQKEHQSLQYLWVFLAENRIADLGINEVRIRWDALENPIVDLNELQSKEENDKN